MVLKALVNDLSVNLGKIDTSLITDLSYLFEGLECRDFAGISTWDTSWNVQNVKDFMGMFKGACSLKQSFETWLISPQTNTSYMFDCQKA